MCGGRLNTANRWASLRLMRNVRIKRSSCRKGVQHRQLLKREHLHWLWRIACGWLAVEGAVELAGDVCIKPRRVELLVRRSVHGPSWIVLIFGDI